MSEPKKFGSQPKQGSLGASGVPGGSKGGASWNAPGRSAMAGNNQFKSCQNKLGDGSLVPEPSPPSPKLGDS